MLRYIEVCQKVGLDVTVKGLRISKAARLISRARCCTEILHFPLSPPLATQETLFPILLLESLVNFSGRDVFSNEEFDHNALFHAPRYLLFAHHSSNSQTGLNRF